MNDSESTLMTKWREDEELAEAMIPLIGRLYRERDAIVHVYGRKLVRQSAIDILRAHRFGRQVTGENLSIKASFPIVEALAEMNLDAVRVDLGQLTTQYEQASDQSIDEFLASALETVTTGRGHLLNEPTDVVLYGFGRIGRLLARILIDRTGSGAKLRLRGIVVRPGKANDLEKRASLLRRDSVHGPFDGTIQIDAEKKQIIANGNPIQLIYATSPDSIDYGTYGIDDAIVIDNTGIWRDDESLGQHLQSKGVRQVLLTAPAKGSVKNIIYGVNDHVIGPDDTILSAASCTTNAIVPTLKVINDTFGIETGHVETVHAYTNDQNLTDNFHLKERRGRSAPLNMVVTETGAAKAAVKALPELEGKITGNAIRVPIPNVSLAILNLNLTREASEDEINSTLREASLGSDLREQIDYTSSTELVSSDLVGSEHAGIIDSAATISNGRQCVLYVWYDNEAGYSYQVARIVQSIAGLTYPSIP